MRYILLFLLFCFSWLNSFTQNCDIPIGTSDFSKLIDTKIVLVGEKHRQDCNYPIQRDLINHFYNQQKRENILIEYGISVAYLLNEYIITNDSALFRDIELFMYADSTFFSWLKNLQKDYERKPFTLHGIDIENQVPMMLFSINRIYKAHNLNFKRLSDFVAADTVRLDNATGLAFDLYADFKRKKELLRTALADDFQLVEHIFFNYDKANTYYEMRHNERINEAREYRETYMLINLKQVLEQGTEDSKYFGQLGHLHCTKKPIDLPPLTDWESITFQLNKSHPNTVATIALFNLESIDETDKLLLKDLKTPITTDTKPFVIPTTNGLFNYIMGY